MYKAIGKRRCPVCNTESDNYRVPNKINFYIECPRCGKFEITGIAIDRLEKDNKIKDKSWIISYWIRNNQIEDGFVLVTSDDLEKIVEETKLPDKLKQSEIILKWLGDELEITQETKIQIKTNYLPAIIGCKDKVGVVDVLDNLEIEELIKAEKETDGNKYSLSIKGLKKYKEIKDSCVFAGKVFMAMQYNDKELDDVYNNHFKEAVKDAGFELFRLDEYPRAGLLDINLREQIKKSQFLLADLTNNNNGVYWEAGFAEGLGKKVIYLCEKAFLNKHKTHFDTNHLLTIKWDKNNIEKAKEELIKTILTTFPTES